MRHLRPTSLAIAAAAIAIAASGCGGDDTSSEDDVREAVTSFVEAGNDRDAEAVCGLVTKEQAETIAQASGGSCEAALEAVLGAADPAETEIVIEDVRVRGERATVDATIKQGTESQAQSISLIREDGEWRLTNPDL